MSLVDEEHYKALNLCSVDPAAAPAAPAPGPSKPAKAAKAQATVEDEEKLKSRQAKYGTSAAKKVEAPVDEEEMRKRKLREERFGVRDMFSFGTPQN